MFPSEYYEGDELPTYKIIIIGKSDAGKTKLLTRYKYKSYEDKGTMTMGIDNIKTQTEQAKYCYYDTAGQDKYKAIVEAYYRGSDACLLVYDVSSITSFEDIDYYYHKVKEVVPQAIIYIVGCKGDKQHLVDQAIVAKKYKGYRHEITSAKNNHNVEEVFRALEDELARTVSKGTNKSHVKPVLKSHHQDERQGKCCK